MSDSAFEELAGLIPEPDEDGSYFWQPFAKRLRKRFEGIPGTDDTGSFVDECLRAGASAVPVIRRNSLWERDAPDRRASTRDRKIYELRIRLGLFFAASLRFLVLNVPRLRVRCGDAEWHGVTEEEQPFSKFAAGQEGKIEIEWTKAAPDFGKACLVTQVFFTVDEALLLTPKLAEEVYNHASPAGPSGLFGLMLVAAGQAEKPSVDVGRIFLHALGEAVEQKALKVNTKMGGHVFITPEFWLLMAPRGLDFMIELIGTKRGVRRHQFSRNEVYAALRAGGYLLGIAEADDTCLCQLKSKRWRKPMELRGLCIAAGVLFSVQSAPFFEGTVTIKEDSASGSSH